MPDWLVPFCRDAGLYVALTTAALAGLMLYSPRLMLQDYPPPIREAVPAKTREENRQSFVVGLPFLVVLFGFPLAATYRFHVFSHAGFLASWAYGGGVALAFNLWDLVVIDWLVFCAWTPSWLVIPGTAGHPAYKDYGFHFRGFLIGTALSAILGLLSAATAVLID